MKTHYIYKITNLITKMSYIGKSKNPSLRFKQHMSLAGKKRHKFYDSILKYSPHNFSLSIIAECSQSEVDDLESHYIEKYNTIEEGYNYTSGGNGGDTFSNRSELSKDITRKKLSVQSTRTNKENAEILRRKSKELWSTSKYRNKVTNAIKLKWNSEEYRKNVSEGLKRVLLDPEKRKKWSDVKKGSKNGRWLGYLEVYRNDILIECFESIADAQRKTNINRGTIKSKLKTGLPYKNKNSVYNMCTFKIKHNSDA